MTCQNVAGATRAGMGRGKFGASGGMDTKGVSASAADEVAAVAASTRAARKIRAVMSRLAEQEASVIACSFKAASGKSVNFPGWALCSFRSLALGQRILRLFPLKSAPRTR